MKTLAFLCLATPMISIASEDDQKGTRFSVYFTLGDKNEFPLNTEKESFGCSDKIFTVVKLINLPKTKYDFELIWRDPSDTVRERTQYPFTVNTTETKLWSWLALSRSDGAAMIQWLNPAAGLEEFIGQWTVEVKVDNKKVTTGSFEVVC